MWGSARNQLAFAPAHVTSREHRLGGQNPTQPKRESVGQRGMWNQTLITPSPTRADDNTCFRRLKTLGFLSPRGEAPAGLARTSGATFLGKHGSAGASPSHVSRKPQRPFPVGHIASCGTGPPNRGASSATATVRHETIIPASAKLRVRSGCAGRSMARWPNEAPNHPAWLPSKTLGALPRASGRGPRRTQFVRRSLNYLSPLSSHRSRPDPAPRPTRTYCDTRMRP